MILQNLFNLFLLCQSLYDNQLSDLFGSFQFFSITLHYDLQIFTIRLFLNINEDSAFIR
jgi:hypothetical protein